MKKFKILALAILAGTLMLSGCAKKEPIAAEKAATLFINQLVFDKDAQDFSANFKDSTNLKEVMQENAKDFETSFIAGIAGTNTSITAEKSDEIAASLLAQVQAKTTYAVEVKAENDETAQIVYHVTGLDYPTIIKKTNENLLAAIKANNGIGKDNAKILATILTELTKNVADAPLKTEPTDITLVLTKDEDKWVVAQDQADKVSNLYLAFISGAKDSEELTAQLAAVSAEVDASVK